MDLKEYQVLAARTAPTNLSDDERRLNCAWGLIGEFGELVDQLKKQRFHGHRDRTKLLHEFGDCMWYLAELATIHRDRLQAATHLPLEGLPGIARLFAWRAEVLARRTYTGDNSPLRVATGQIVMLAESHGFSLDEVLTANIEKLRERYADGFSGSASKGRS